MPLFTKMETYHFPQERIAKNYFEIELNIKDPFKDTRPCWYRWMYPEDVFEASEGEI